jgi:hypothetical protein
VSAPVRLKRHHRKTAEFARRDSCACCRRSERCVNSGLNTTSPLLSSFAGVGECEVGATALPHAQTWGGAFAFRAAKIELWCQVRPSRRGACADGTAVRVSQLCPHQRPDCKQLVRKFESILPQRASFTGSWRQEISREGRLSLAESAGVRFASQKAAKRPRRL